MTLRAWLGLTTGILLVFAAASTISAQLQATHLTLGDGQSSPVLPKPGWDPDGFSKTTAAFPSGSDIAQVDQPHESGIGFSSLASSNDLRLSGYQQQTVTAAPGSTVTLNLQNFLLSGHSTLSLMGDAASTFIINVTGQFSLSQRSKIVLSSGLQYTHVFFNILGTGSTVSLSGKSGFFGILSASQRTVRLTGRALVYGSVFASRVVLRQAAQIFTPPPVSE